MRLVLLAVLVACGSKDPSARLPEIDPAGSEFGEGLHSTLVVAPARARVGKQRFDVGATGIAATEDELGDAFVAEVKTWATNDLAKIPISVAASIDRSLRANTFRQAGAAVLAACASTYANRDECEERARLRILARAAGMTRVITLRVARELPPPVVVPVVLRGSVVTERLSSKQILECFRDSSDRAQSGIVHFVVKPSGLVEDIRVTDIAEPAASCLTQLVPRDLPVPAGFAGQTFDVRVSGSPGMGGSDITEPPPPAYSPLHVVVSLGRDSVTVSSISGRAGTQAAPIQQLARSGDFRVHLAKALETIVDKHWPNTEITMRPLPDRNIYVTATDDVSMQDLTATLAAVRATESGKPLFPEPVFVLKP